jgi:hypothetical protein
MLHRRNEKVLSKAAILFRSVVSLLLTTRTAALLNPEQMQSFLTQHWEDPIILLRFVHRDFESAVEPAEEPKANKGVELAFDKNDCSDNEYDDIPYSVWNGDNMCRGDARVLCLRTKEQFVRDINHAVAARCTIPATNI